ncbi:hypothetical protein GIB67_008024 [Kingdonia uniflora]|uniref:Proteasome alpha-type subunits domain-containing protein n=1 Tax=Kingdonia uniflora TaxID=39325 RepID=A0A7J7KV07_9MAGN|nr:hypothetical protein GIB67_008024 [Kingdonia uniflora]
MPDNLGRKLPTLKPSAEGSSLKPPINAVSLITNSDVTTWSPAGRLFQIEYAIEAVKQGSVAISLQLKTHVVLASINKANSKLSSHQKKIFKADDHIGIAIAGLTADGGFLSKYLRSDCINYTFTYESPLPFGRLVVQLADNAQVCTQRSWKRPYGVGLLVAGLDESGAHLYCNCPSGNYFEYQAFTIGSRSQAAKIYLERKYETLMGRAYQACTLCNQGNTTRRKAHKLYLHRGCGCNRWTFPCNRSEYHNKIGGVV